MRLSTICLKTAPLHQALQLAILHANLRHQMQQRHLLRLQLSIVHAKVRQRIETTRNQIALHTSRCQTAYHSNLNCSPSGTAAA